jgi:hypothetical protein
MPRSIFGVWAMVFFMVVLGPPVLSAAPAFSFRVPEAIKTVNGSATQQRYNQVSAGEDAFLVLNDRTQWPHGVRPVVLVSLMGRLFIFLRNQAIIVVAIGVVEKAIGKLIGKLPWDKVQKGLCKAIEGIRIQVATDPRTKIDARASFTEFFREIEHLLACASNAAPGSQGATPAPPIMPPAATGNAAVLDRISARRLNTCMGRGGRIAPLNRPRGCSSGVPFACRLRGKACKN